MNNLARNIFLVKGKFMGTWLQRVKFKKSSCLNIIIDSIVLWNTRYLSKAWKHHKRKPRY